MSPLKVTMLLRLHTYAYPFQDMPFQQVEADAMIEAFAFFQREGLLCSGVTRSTVRFGDVDRPFLSEKGKALVRKICEVEP